MFRGMLLALSSATMRAPPAVDAFLATKRIAIVGVSRDPKSFSRAVVRAFDEAGYDPVIVNTAAEPGAIIAGRESHASLRDLEHPVEAVLVMASAESSPAIVEDAVVTGAKLIWLYGPGTGEKGVHPVARGLARRAGLEVIAGECPYMFLPGQAWFHRLHGAIRSLSENWPKLAPQVRQTI